MHAWAVKQDTVENLHSKHLQTTGAMQCSMVFTQIFSLNMFEKSLNFHYFHLGRRALTDLSRPSYTASQIDISLTANAGKSSPFRCVDIGWCTIKPQAVHTKSKCKKVDTYVICHNLSIDIAVVKSNRRSRNPRNPYESKNQVHKSSRQSQHVIVDQEGWSSRL